MTAIRLPVSVFCIKMVFLFLAFINIDNSPTTTSVLPLVKLAGSLPSAASYSSTGVSSYLAPGAQILRKT